MLIDCNELEHGYDVKWSCLDNSETYLVYGLEYKGDKHSRVYIRDLETGKEEHILTSMYFQLQWSANGKGFFYTRDAADGDTDASAMGKQVWHHEFNEDIEKDILLFDVVAQGLPENTGLSISALDDSKYLLVTGYVSYTDHRNFLVSLEDHGRTVLPILEGEPHRHYARLLDGYVYDLTTSDANNFRVIRSPIEEAHLPIGEWEEFIPESADRVLKDVEFSKDFAIALYSHNVSSEVVLFNRTTGTPESILDLPDLTGLRSLSANSNNSDFYYSLGTPLECRSYFRFDGETSSKFYQENRYMDAEKVTAWQEWFTSADGQKIPMFMIGPKEAKRRFEAGQPEPSPILLGGYGGFGLGMFPEDCYDDLRRIWAEQGGIVAIPNIRGGNEFGDSWHKDIIGAQNKQLTFTDMIRCAEHLIEQGWTAPGKIVLSGGSNGGLLVGACAIQRPELFAAVDCRVPLLDMLEFPNYLLGHHWVEEYGNPKTPEDFAAIQRYSPYHNIQPDVTYPPFYFSVRANDTVVHSVHAFKMAARLQELNTTSPVLVRTDFEAGHDSGSGVTHWLQQQSQRLAFMMHQAGMKPVFDAKK